MKYEYKSLPIGGENSSIDNIDLNSVNNLYDDGWEFVSAVAQKVSYSAGSISWHRYAPIIFTLRKPIVEELFPT